MWDPERGEDEDDLDFVDDLLDIADLQEAQRAARAPVYWRNRVNPMDDNPNPREFKVRYRFSRENVKRIVNLVKPYLGLGDTNCGLPCAAEFIVCSALKTLTGGNFFHVGGYASGICTETAWNHLYRFVDAILETAV